MRPAITLSLGILLFASACSKKPALYVDRAEPASRPLLGFSMAAHTLPAAVSAGAVSERYIAVQHKVEVVSSDDKLPGVWDALIKFCGTLQCEVTASSITARSSEAPASASITVRVAPQDSPKLLTQVEKEGNVVQHTTVSEDKTTQVVDAEARLKNLTAYRDSLRGMLGRPGLNVKDSVEIQEKLTDVQSDLDSETAKRKILANETEKVAVGIELRVQDSRPTPQRLGATRSGARRRWGNAGRKRRFRGDLRSVHHPLDPAVRLDLVDSAVALAQETRKKSSSYCWAGELLSVRNGE
jgi:Domain of unknown function (DUF4349)